MNSELNILKNIWGNKGKSYVKLISSQTGLGLDYVRYICKQLLKKGQIKAERKPNWYRITAKGKKGLKLQEIIRPERKIERVKKVVLPWPKELLKIRRPKGKEIPVDPVRNNISNGVEEKKLKLGRMLEKTISFLRASTFSTKGRKRALLRQGYGGQGKRKKYVKRRKIKSS